MPPQILAIVGPTGSGKTSLSISLAKLFNGEIISADSRQIYRYMDIGTAKPSPETLRAINHHFIGILNPDEGYNAGQFSKDGRVIIKNIVERQKLPIIVGGSGLYIEALIDGFFEGPSADPEFRNRYYERLKNEGAEVLHEELRGVDPDAASKMAPSNLRRIIRALEVFHITGNRISELQKATEPLAIQTYFIALDWDRKKLYQRLNRRVDDMFNAGLIDEVKKLLQKGYAKELNSLQTVGYKETIQFLEGEISHDEMVELVKRNTRRYAKRQLTWFRPDPRIQWIPVDEGTDYENLVKNIYRDFTLAKDRMET